jgi:hypothetical protein
LSASVTFSLALEKSCFAIFLDMWYVMGFEFCLIQPRYKNPMAHLSDQCYPIHPFLI